MPLSSIDERALCRGSFARRIGLAIANFFQRLSRRCCPCRTLRFQGIGKNFSRATHMSRPIIMAPVICGSAGHSGLDSGNRFTGDDALAFVRVARAFFPSCMLLRAGSCSQSPTFCRRLSGLFCHVERRRDISKYSSVRAGLAFSLGMTKCSRRKARRPCVYKANVPRISFDSFQEMARRKRNDHWLNTQVWKLRLGEWIGLVLALCAIVSLLCILLIRRHTRLNIILSIPLP